MTRPPRCPEGDLSTPHTLTALAHDNLILTIDLGTGGPKVALFTSQGECLAHEFEETPLILLDQGGAEQDPETWWEAIAKASRRLFSNSGIDPKKVVALNLTAQWSGTVAVDAKGKALMNAIIWMDSRGAPQIKKIVDGPLKIEGYAAGKILKWLKLTGGAPGQSGKDPIAHILYIREKHPEIYRNTHKFLEPKDYLNLRLTGKFAATYESITLHWVTDNRKIDAIDYNKGLLKLTTLEREKLPDLLPPNSLLGTVLPEAATDLGLTAEVKVFSGTPDLQSAAVGSGAVMDFEPHLYIGTSSWLTCHVPWKKTDINHNMAALPAGIPGKYFIANEQETAGEVLDYLKDQLLYPKDAISDSEAPEDFYDRLSTLANTVPAGSDGLLFLPWLYGERSPVEDHHLRGGFFNLSLRHSRAHLVRAMLEGVAFNSRWLLGYVEKMAGNPFKAINFIGGGAQSEVWCQIFADVFDRPIRQVKDPILANAKGAAYLASVAMGFMTWEEVSKKAEIRRTYTPNPAHREVYEQMFKEFLAYYKRNKKAFKRLNAKH